VAIPRPEFSPPARRDLLNIVSRSTEDWGSGQASRYRSAPEQTCDRLAAYPEMGLIHPELGDVQAFPSQRHRILYRPLLNGVLILRVIDQRMRLSNVDLS